MLLTNILNVFIAKSLSRKKWKWQKCSSHWNSCCSWRTGFSHLSRPKYQRYILKSNFVKHNWNNWFGLIDFVKTGKSRAVVRVTLANKGQGSYKRDTFGDYITIERTINATSGGGGYKILNQQGIYLLMFNQQFLLNQKLLWIFFVKGGPWAPNEKI